MLTIIRSSAIIATLSIAGISTAVQAEYVGPASAKAKPALSVAEVLKKPVDNQAVLLSGVLMKKVGNEKYLFSDGTGEIRVEIENEVFPAQTIDGKTKVELKGEVEKDFLDTPEIDVDLISVAK